MNRVLIATMLMAALPAWAVVVPADAPQETVVDRLLAESGGRMPLAATVNGQPVPVEAALALLRANDVPMPQGAENVVSPDVDLGVGVRVPNPSTCVSGGFVVANSLGFGSAPPPAIANVQSTKLAPSEPLLCVGGTLQVESWIGTVSADRAATAIVAVACLRGPAPFTNGVWQSGHHQVTNCHANDFTSASVEGRVAVVDIVLDFGSLQVRIGQLFGATHAGPDGRDAAVFNLA